MSSNFNTLIKNEFKFLEDNFKYTCTRFDENVIEYSTEDVVITFSYDEHRSYEIDCTFQLLQSKDQEFPFTLAELLSHNNVSETNFLNGIQVSDKKKLKPIIHKISSFLKKYGQEILQGKENVYSSLQNFRNENSKNYTNEIILSDLLTKAEKVWNEKNYSEYYELLNPHKDKLKDSDKKKLLFSKKRIDSK